MKSVIHSIRGFATILPIAIPIAACGRELVDVGTNAESKLPQVQNSDAQASSSGYGCAEWNDQEISRERGFACNGTCDDSAGDPANMLGKKAFIAATAGQWLFCGAHIGPDEAVGVEFAPGCRLFFLIKNSVGEIVRGTLKSQQASYDIAPSRGWGAFDLHLNNVDSTPMTAEVSLCPGRMKILGPNGAKYQLATDTKNPGFGDGGVPNPPF